MRSRHSKVLFFLVLVCCFILHNVEGGGPDFQGSRDFDNVCDGCVVSKGIGFQSFFDDCSCFFTCNLVMSPKLSSMASPYVSYKKCCACDEAFSKKLLTCVRYYDKRSDCFDSAAANPCDGDLPGTNITRQRADIVYGTLSISCSGYSTCVNVSGVVVPQQKCCPPGLCYNPVDGECNPAGCDVNPTCAVLRDEELDDCNCTETTAPASECQYMAVENSLTRFMGIEQMAVYDCPIGTCWDQASCTCVMANNTGYNECREFLNLEFDVDLNATDALGNLLYTNIHGPVFIEEGAAVFDQNGQINVVGTANTWYSNDLVLHFAFTLTEDGTSSFDRTQCIVGNCKVFEQPSETDTFAVTITRDETAVGEEINIFLLYQDRVFMNLPGSTASGNFEVEGTFALDTEYDFWLIYCGSEEEVFAGVLNEGGTAIAASDRDVIGSVQLIGSQTGFLFGDCRRSGALEGTLDEVELYRNCKPVDDPEFEEAFEEILGFPIELYRNCKPVDDPEFEEAFEEITGVPVQVGG